MRQKTLLIIYFFTSIGIGFGQDYAHSNLVINPHFQHSSEITRRGQIRKAEGWHLSINTVDLFCSKTSSNSVKNHKNFIGEQLNEGNADYIGYFAFYNERKSEAPYFEYPQGQLSQPLKVGKKYHILFEISLADHYGLTSKGIGVHFSEYPLGLEENENIISAQPQIVFNEKYFDDKERWLTLHGTFTAKGGECYFAIGSFKDYFEVKKTDITKQNYYQNSAYYYIRNGIRVEESPLTIQEFKQLKEATNLILFNTNSAEIKIESYSELDKIADLLNRNPEVFVGIEGHTDNIGTEAINLPLSKNRAKSIADYLIKKGIKANRVHSNGYGSSRPVADNNTEEGRQQNRRVEIKTIIN